MDKTGVPKEAQDDALSDGMSGGRQTPLGRPTRGNAALTTVFFLAAASRQPERRTLIFFSKCRTSEKPVIPPTLSTSSRHGNGSGAAKCCSASYNAVSNCRIRLSTANAITTSPRGH